MASTTLVLLAVLAAVAIASAQYPYVLFNYGRPGFIAQPAHHVNIVPHSAFKQGAIVYPAVGYAMIQPSEVNPAFVPEAIVPGSEKKFGSTHTVTSTKTVFSGTVHTETKFVLG